MKWHQAKDVPSQILFYAGACQALWINEEVTFCESEVNEKGQRKSPFVPKQVLMENFASSYLPEGGFFCYLPDGGFFFHLRRNHCYKEITDKKSFSHWASWKMVFPEYARMG